LFCGQYTIALVCPLLSGIFPGNGGTCHSTVDSEDEIEVGYLGTKSLLARGGPLTAIFAGNDVTAQGVYKALRNSGLRVPEDISVVGCDDTLGSCLHPALTTVREFPEQLGKQMVELALGQIDAPNRPSQHVTVPTELIRRDSCQAIVPSTEVAGAEILHGTATE
jgi:DNA-binding LacI/PurR family transcriptional regulator